MKLGSLFKEFRLNKQFKLNEAAEGIVTTRFLNKFEKNESDISTWKFFELLERINVSVEKFTVEFYQESNSVTIDKLEKEFEIIVVQSSEEMWDEVYQENVKHLSSTKMLHNSFYDYVDIIIKYSGNQALKKNFFIDSTPLISYLESIEMWGKTEFFLANYIAGNENVETLTKLWYQAFSKKIKSPVIQKFSADFYLHICFHLLKLKEITLTKQFMIDYETNQEPESTLRNLSLACFSQFIKGMIMVLEGNSKGEIVCNGILDFFRDQVGYADYAYGLKNSYSKITS